MELLNQYLEIKKEIHQYFGYVEDWVVIPIEDAREYSWVLNEADGYVRFADTEEMLYSDGDYCEHEIYTQRFLPKWVYRGEKYTMVCVDTHVDGNKFLQIFDNKKECDHVPRNNN